MQITCPHCQARLGLPDEAAGKKARCTSCQTVFLVPDEAPRASEHVQAGAPPPLLEPEPDEDDERPRRRDEDDEEEEDFDRARAAAGGRRAGLLMYIAGGAYLLDSLISIPLGIVVMHANPPPQGAPVHVVNAAQYSCLGCQSLVSLVLILFVFLGAHQVRNLRGQGLVITGVVMCYIIVLYMAVSVVLSVFSLVTDFGGPDKLPALINLVMDSTSGVLMLIAGIAGTMALLNRDVQAMYTVRRP